MAGKKTAKQVMDEWEAKMRGAVGAVQDPQFQQDVMANAQALPGKVAQGAMNAGNKLGNAMEGFDPTLGTRDDRFLDPSVAKGIDAINQGGTALRQGIYDLRTGGQPAAPYPDVGQLMTGNAESINANMQPQGMMPRPGQTGVMENQIIGEMQQMGIPITPEMVQKYMAFKAQASQQVQGAGQAIQGAGQQGMDAMRGLLQ